MRLELALIFGIIFFCCWCAYLVLNMNSSLQLPTLSTTTSEGQAQASSSSSSSNQTNQLMSNLYSKPHNKVPQVYQQQQQQQYSSQQHYPQQTTRQTQYAAAPYATQVHQTPNLIWGSNGHLAGPQINTAHNANHWPVQPPAAYSSATANYEAAPSEQLQLNSALQDPDATSLATAEPTDQEQQSDDEAAEEEENSEEPATQQQAEGAEELEATDEEPAAPVQSELEERVGRRSFSEDEDDASERDRNGLVIKENRRHFINGRPVARRSTGTGTNTNANTNTNGRNLAAESDLSKGVNFDELVSEIDAAQGGTQNDRNENEEDEDSADEPQAESSNELRRRVDDYPAKGDQVEESDEADDVTKRRQNSNKNIRVNESALEANVGANKLQASSLRLSSPGGGELSDSPKSAAGVSVAKSKKKLQKPKNSQKHQLRESLTATKWDDDVQGTTQENEPQLSEAEQRQHGHFTGADIDRAIEAQEKRASLAAAAASSASRVAKPSAESIIEFEDLDLLASERRPAQRQLTLASKLLSMATPKTDTDTRGRKLERKRRQLYYDNQNDGNSRIVSTDANGAFSTTTGKANVSLSAPMGANNITYTGNTSRVHETSGSVPKPQASTTTTNSNIIDSYLEVDKTLFAPSTTNSNNNNNRSSITAASSAGLQDDRKSLGTWQLNATAAHESLGATLNATAARNATQNATRESLDPAADMSIELLAQPPPAQQQMQPDAYTVTALQPGTPTYVAQGPVALVGGGPYGLGAASGKHKKKEKVIKKKKKKKKKVKKASKMAEHKYKAAKAHASKRKKKYKKGYIRAKEAKLKKKAGASHKYYKKAERGKKGAKGQAQRGGKKGSIYLKDKGYKKRGFKKAYQKVEAGDHKTYFDEFRDKDHNKKWKHFKDGHHYSRKKHWAGKDKKEHKHRELDSMKHKKAKAGHWSEKKKSKYSKDYKHKSNKAKKSGKAKKKKKKKKVYEKKM